MQNIFLTYIQSLSKIGLLNSYSRFATSNICGGQSLKKNFKGYLPQILLGPFLNTLSYHLLATQSLKAPDGHMAVIVSKNFPPSSGNYFFIICFTINETYWTVRCVICYAKVVIQSKGSSSIFLSILNFSISTYVLNVKMINKTRLNSCSRY